MRKRKSILIVALILIVGGFSLYYGWNIFHANEKIRDYFLEKLRPVLSQQFNIEQLQVSLGAVHLKNVTLDFGNYSLRIEDVRIGYSITSLIRYGFKPASITNNISLKKPVFLLRPSLPHKNIPKDSLTNVTAAQGQQKQQSLDFIKRITFSDGQILLDDSTSVIQIASQINGWINAQDLALAVAQAEGQLFGSSQKNLSLLARINLLEWQVMQLDANLSHFGIQNLPQEILPDSLKIFNGILNGNLQFLRDEKNVCVGSFAISQGAYQIVDSSFYFQDLNLEADLYDRDIIIRKSSQLFHGSKIEITGTIFNIFSPQLDLVIKSDRLNLGNLWKNYLPFDQVLLQGFAMTQIKVQKAFDNPQITGEISADNFLVNNSAGNRFSARFTLMDSVFSLTRFKSLILDNNLSLKGKINRIFSVPELNLKISAKGNSVPYFQQLGFETLKNGDYTFDASISGALTDPQAKGNLAARIINLTDNIFDVEFNINYAHGQFDIQSTGNLTYKFSLDGKVGSIWQNPVFNIRMKNAQRILPLFYPEIPVFLRSATTNLTFQGNFRQGDIYLEMLRRNRSRLLILLTEISRHDSLQDISGELVFNPESEQRLRSNFHFVKSPQFFKIDSLKIADFLTTSGDAHFDKDKILDGSFQLDNARLSTLVGIFFPNQRENYSGTISGKIKAEGDLANPHITGQFRLQDGSFNKIGMYESDLIFNYQNHIFYLQDFSLSLNKKVLNTLQGSYDRQSKNINFRLNSPFFDVEQFLTSFGSDSSSIQGNGFFDIKFTNTLENPQIDGFAQIVNGKIDRFHFDSLTCVLGKGYPVYWPKNKPRFSGSESALKISQLIIKRNKEFEIAVKGNIPYSKERDMKIQIQGKGNFLAILPELTTYFIETKSEGWLNFELAGRPDSPIFARGDLEFYKGNLKVYSVFDQFRNIHGKLHFDPRARFLQIADLSGTVRGETFEISNRETGPATAKRTLEPFFLEDWGLNLGVLQIATSEKGLPVNIPGLMEKGELGFFQLEGLAPDERTYIAGPWHRPVVRGKVLLQNLNFTYPFLETQSDTGSLVMKILESIDWDLNLISKKDTRYVRRIYGAPDAVDVNLMVNDGGEGLRIRGAVGDESIFLEGEVESNRGYVEYLDFNFRIEHAGAVFDRTSIFPFVYGKARTALIDSTGFSNQMWLTLYLIDPITHEKQDRGRWDEPNLYFELTSDNVDLGSSEGEILTNLGYSVKNIKQKAPDILGISADNLLFKPIFRPFERRIERLFGLDYVQFRSRIARNWLERNLSHKEYGLTRYSLLRNSRVVLGKYVTDRWFFLYKGELESPLNYQPSLPPLGLRHTLGLEYQIKPNLLLEMEYDYSSMLFRNKDDKKIMLRHSFPF